MPGVRSSWRVTVPSLPELQRRFTAAVLGPEDPPAGAGFDGPGLQVYRTNARENFTAALMTGFPVLLALMGEAAFRRMARAYQRRQPSRSGNLAHVGRALPAFLARSVADPADARLADVAALEWAVQEVTFAADAAGALDFGRLATVPEADHGRLGFTLHPAARLIASAWPVFALWQRYRGESPPVEDHHGPDHVLVRRVGRGVELARLPAGEYHCLAALAGGAPLMVALEAGLARQPGLDLGGILRRWAVAGLLVDVRWPDHR